jgi:hypothetical protein
MRLFLPFMRQKAPKFRAGRASAKFFLRQSCQFEAIFFPPGPPSKTTLRPILANQFNLAKSECTPDNVKLLGMEAR